MNSVLYDIYFVDNRVVKSIVDQQLSWLDNLHLLYKILPFKYVDLLSTLLGGSCRS